MVNIKNYKQILIICGLLIAIIVCVVIYFYKNKQEDYSYLEVSNNEVISEINVVQEVKVEIFVHVTGQVVNQGVVRVQEGARVIDAIEAAGGAKAEANLSKINLAYLLEDGMKIYVPSVNDDENVEFVSSGSGNSESSNKEVLRVNINTATSEELEKLPGVGESIANRIVAYRKENGKFRSIEDLKNVSGIGDAKFNNIKEFVYVK